MKTVEMEFGGRTFSLETGRLAKLANGAVMVRYGDTMVLAVAVASSAPREGIDFLPLQVEYREKYAAVGKIPGGFFKREARPTEKEILSARLIDRPIRPMFTKGWTYETQIICTTYSFDQENDPDVLGAVGSSCALLLSGMPFSGPISNVRVGHIDGEFVINPTIAQLADSTLEIVVSGTDSSIVMVEGESKEISEELFLQALEFGHQHIRMLNDLQRQLVALCDVTSLPMPDKKQFTDVTEFIREHSTAKLAAFAREASSKEGRQERYKLLREEIAGLVSDHFSGDTHPDLEVDKIVGSVLHDLESDAMREMILNDGTRLDGRSTTEIRSISCEVDVLPRTHGSALFTRGETQSLTSMTLGTKLDRQLIDGLLPKHDKRFMLHYNFPPFSTGETGRFGSTSRREIGHGNLAERGLKEVLPAESEFPYTIRIVSDILESNGSSSMATVCAGTLSLMQGGVPIRKPVAGIAMGLIYTPEKVAILSDILGDEDHLGDMDFKVVGTRDGITACQMDIKIQGISLEIMGSALEQARQGRLHILDKMAETITEPAHDLSPYAPRLTTIQIPVEMIGAVIGSGGETIRGIVAESGAEINIEEDGTIVIAAVSGESAERAVALINRITEQPEVGKTYEGRVVQIREGLGAIVEFLPKKTGLLHISQLEHHRVENVEDVLSVGERVQVKLLEISDDGKYRLSRKALLPVPEGMTVSEDNGYRGDRGGDRGGPRGDRGGSRGGDRGGPRNGSGGSRGGDRDRRR
ncbi:MAG TPA: polyribonucleotide nucleotidyltransferase [Candidatus Kapabacteria bacterium]|nr:polyribonucleotide nucleotidyltransferase [Candidatus Kapabacteria bacterium]